MLLKTPTAITEEIRQVIAKRAPILRASVAGRLFVLDRTATSTTAQNHSQNIWILRAQIGTLDKLQVLFAHEGDYRTFELLGIARNLFENLVWLRLFGRDPRYGIVFYRQLLDQQAQNTRQMIAKVKAEIELFDDYDTQDSAAFDETVIRAALESRGIEAVREAEAAHRLRTAELDMRVRRAFTLYGAAAAFNSYAYQAHLMREQVIPKHEADLASIEVHRDQLAPELLALLGQSLLNISNAKWNWRGRALDVGMGPQYDFLYTFTSKLLHATPLNLITDKMLSGSEALTMLEYAFVAIEDLLDEIERFSFDGEANLLLIEND